MGHSRRGLLRSGALHPTLCSDQYRRGSQDGEQVDGTFFRQADRRDDIDAEAVPGGDITAVGWVQRSDTGVIEGFLQSDITPTPETDVRISIGKAYEVMQDV